MEMQHKKRRLIYPSSSEGLVSSVLFPEPFGQAASERYILLKSRGSQSSIAGRCHDLVSGTGGGQGHGRWAWLRYCSCSCFAEVPTLRSKFPSGSQM